MYEKTLIVKVTVPAGQAQYSELVGKIISDPAVGEVQSVQVPVTETWVIKDVYTKSSPAIDLNVRIIKNQRKPLQEIVLGTQVISNPARPKIKPMAFGPGDVLSVKAVNLAAGGSSDTTIEFYLRVEILERGKDY